MATAYAALVSLMNTIAMEQRPRYHPHRQISLDYGGLIEDLQKWVNILVEILEVGYKGAEHLLERITEAAYAAEDAIECYVVDQVLPPEDTILVENRSAVFCLDLRKAKREMQSIAFQALDFIGEGLIEGQDGHGGSSISAGSSSASPHGEEGEIKDLCPVGISTSASPSSAPQWGKESTMVGFEDEKKEVIDKLTLGSPSLDVISIVGMGGSGKTKLARNIFNDQNIMEHFDVCVWIAVSQEYDVKRILSEVLRDPNKNFNIDYETLGTQVHKSLFDRTYLIVLDDIWSIEPWDEIQIFFPNDGNRSRIMVTTRNFTLANKVCTLSSPVFMECLNKDQSWELLCTQVFGKNRCPIELESVGEKILKNCKGLPLSIVVVGGLLATNKTIEYWEHVAKQSSPACNVDEGMQCLNLLSLSCNHLPIYIKPCFLYMGVFPEDHEISCSKLIKLWIAEGFVGPGRTDVSLEKLAHSCLSVLILRNLITIEKFDYPLEIVSCTMHDLKRKMCLREAEREFFFNVVTSYSQALPPRMIRPRRLAILLNTSEAKEYPVQMIDSLTSNPRSVIVNNYEGMSRLLESSIFRLTRVFFVMEGCHGEAEECLSTVLFKLVNLRYLSCEADKKFITIMVSSIGLLGNLQVLDMNNI